MGRKENVGGNMWKKGSLYGAIVGLLLILNNQSAKAQEIITDGTTATIVTRNGQRIVIDGNTLSRDGKNLFHSFREFGLTPQEIATFLTNPQIQNILTRVTGGNPSYINGLIEVVGGNSNLFLMNPAGIVFGKNARINVPADFVATTATGIGFGNGIFNAVGSNDYQNLVGNPTSFIFNTNQPGSIINAGQLQGGEGRNITLVGGNIINTGTIETAGGKIHIEAVEGSSRIKITPEGSLLSLELEIPRDEQGNLLGFTPLELPTLLTGANQRGVETPKVTVSNNRVEVENTSIPSSGGVTIVSGRLNTSSTQTGGRITVTGGRVGLIKAEIAANGATEGGKVLIGGDYQGRGSITNSRVTVVDGGSRIEANALTRGNGGRVIVWSDGNTAFRGEITAKGGNQGGDGGFVEVSGKQNLNFQGRVDTSAPRGNAGILLLDPENVRIVDQTSAADDSQISDGQILAGDGVGSDYTISRGALESLSYLNNIVVEANNNIEIEDLDNNVLSFQSPPPFSSISTSITFRADADNNGSGDFRMATDNVIRAPGRNVNIFGNNITVGAIDTVPPEGVNGGNININARGNVTIGGSTVLSSLITFVPANSSGNAGSVSVTSENGSITILQGDIFTFTPNGQAGNITLEARNGDINLPPLILLWSGFGGTDNSGRVTLNARNINPGSSLTSTARFLARGGIAINTENLNVAVDNGLDSPLQITGSNTLNLNQTINNVGSVTLSLLSPGSISIGGDIAASSLTVNAANTNLRGDINTNGNQDYNTNLLLTGDASLTGGNITFNGSIDSANTPYSLTVVALESIRYNGRIGATVGLNNLENIARDIFLNISRSGLEANAPSIRTTGSQSYTLTSNTLYLAKDTVINTRDFVLDGNIKVANSASEGVSLTINASGGVRITAPTSGDITDAINTARGNRGGDVTINASGDVIVDGVITTSNPTPTTIVPQGGNVSIQSNGNLVLGPIGTVGQSQSGRVSLTGENIAVGTIVTEINQGGLVIGRGGGIDISANNTLVVGNILGESVTVTGNLLLTNLGVLQQPLPGNIPPEYQPFLNTSRVITSGSQQYNGQVFLDDNTIYSGSNIALKAVDSFDLSLPGAINQLTPSQIVTSILQGIANRGNANASSLTLNATSQLNLGGEMGEIAGLASLTVSSPTTTVNTPLIRTTGDQNYNTNLLLGDDVTLTSNSSIRLLGDVTGVGNLTLNSDSVFAGGRVNLLGSLSVTGSNFVVATDTISTTENQQIDSNISLQNSVDFTAGGVFFARNITGSGTSVNIKANSIRVGDITTGGGDVNLNASGANTITGGNIISGGGDISLTSSGDIQVTSISSSSGRGGGNIQVSTPGNFRVTGFTRQGVSIDASGGGSVTIDLFPGGFGLSSRLPFTIGNPSRNGTAGIITNTNFFIPPGDYFFTTRIGNLNLLLLNTRDGTDPGTIVQPPETISPPPAAALPPAIPIATIAEAKKILTAIEEEAAEKPAVIYVSFSPRGYQPRDIEEEFARREASNTQEYNRIGVNKVDVTPTVNFQRRDDDLLDLLIITSRGEPVRIVVPVTRKEVVEAANRLWETAQEVDSDDYKTYASQLYQWLIAPIEGKLKEREISNLVFLLPAEIRFLPVAALYDSQNQQFLVEKYSSGLAPSLNLNDNRYRPIKNANLLAMGASQFAQPDVSPLPAVRVEIPTIKRIWEGEKTEEYQRYLDENFTLDNLKRNLTEKPHQIVHLGTHGKFSGLEEAYIQLYDGRLGLKQIDILPLNQPLVELMVLSACETAFGDEIAELGFAGLAVKAGVKSAMGSVWEVSDTGTLALMTEFYAQLKQQNTKAEALRQAQLALLKGKVRKTEDGKKIITPQLQIPLEGLPEEALIPEDLSHPFYWAPFTMIGNPW